MAAPVTSYPFTRGDRLSLVGSVPARLASSNITSATGVIRHPKHPAAVFDLEVTLAPYVDDNTDRDLLIECAPEVTALFPDGQMVARLRFMPVSISSGPIYLDVRT